MTIKEAYQIWLNKYDPPKCGYYCVFGELEGGSGFYGLARCKLANHSNIFYGKEFCPENCPDYVEDAYIKSFSRFEHLIHDAYEKKWLSDLGIDVDDIDEIKAEKQKEFDKMQQVTDNLQKIYSTFEKEDTTE